MKCQGLFCPISGRNMSEILDFLLTLMTSYPKLKASLIIVPEYIEYQLRDSSSFIPTLNPQNSVFPCPNTILE